MWPTSWVVASAMFFASFPSRWGKTHAGEYCALPFRLKTPTKATPPQELLQMDPAAWVLGEIRARLP